MSDTAVQFMVKLHCEIGNHDWERPSQRGRKPLNCPEHQPVKPVPRTPRVSSTSREISSGAVITDKTDKPSRRIHSATSHSALVEQAIDALPLLSDAELVKQVAFIIGNLRGTRPDEDKRLMETRLKDILRGAKTRNEGQFMVLNDSPEDENSAQWVVVGDSDDLKWTTAHNRRSFDPNSTNFI